MFHWSLIHLEGARLGHGDFEPLLLVWRRWESEQVVKVGQAVASLLVTVAIAVIEMKK
jgi:hypothetical protein